MGFEILGIWGFEDLGVWKFGDVWIWGCGDLGIWKFGDLGIRGQFLLVKNSLVSSSKKRMSSFRVIKPL